MGLPAARFRGFRHLVGRLHEVRLLAFVVAHGVRLLLVSLDLLRVGEVLIAYIALHDTYLLVGV
jgi:hypothetical protein